jgi:hypothetical protein
MISGINFWKGHTSLYKGHFFPWWYHYPEEQDLEFLQPTPEFRRNDKEMVLSKQHPELTDVHFVWRRLKVAESGGNEGEFQRKYPEDPATCFLYGSESIFPTEVLVALWKTEKAPPYVGDLTLG